MNIYCISINIWSCTNYLWEFPYIVFDLRSNQCYCFWCFKVNIILLVKNLHLSPISGIDQVCKDKATVWYHEYSHNNILYYACFHLLNNSAITWQYERLYQLWQADWWWKSNILKVSFFLIRLVWIPEIQERFSNNFEHNESNKNTY